MGGKSTKHHIVAAWRTSMSRKVPVLKFGVMGRGTTLFYFWRFIDQDYFVLQAAFNIFFDDFWVYKPFCTLFFRWDITASCYGFLHLLYDFFVNFVAEAFYISLPYLCLYKNPFEPVQKLFLSTGVPGSLPGHPRVGPQEGNQTAHHTMERSWLKMQVSISLPTPRWRWMPSLQLPG